MNLIIVIILFVILTVIGMPLAFSLGISSFLTIAFMMNVPLGVLVERMIIGVDSFLLIAVPLFILAANIMNKAGITTKIFSFARSIVGSLPGSLGHANILASVVFAGISGSAVADNAALGRIEIKAMDDQGYPRKYSAAITCASATIGPIFPPSIPMVIYGGIAGVSVGKLFLGGVIPGLLIALTLMILNHNISVKNNYPRDESFSLGNVVREFRASFLPIMTPALIVGGIVFGIFTPTEAAAFAVFYAFILGLFIYRELKWSMIPGIFLETICTSTIVLFIISAASVLQWILTVEQLGVKLANMATSVDSPLIFLIIINLILFLFGMVMETTAVLIIMTPFFVPIAQSLGIDLVHLGVAMVLNLMIGLSTPPFGLGLFTVSEVSELSIEDLAIAILPFIPVLIISLVLVILFPALTLWLPSLFF
ncbi:MAG: ABC transporter permease [Clostridiaceae bacterium BRH_c20a]|nr:MAG: ABC transporter permease [Clostridiaceae bacterium BRH_c20a]